MNMTKASKETTIKQYSDGTYIVRIPIYKNFGLVPPFDTLPVYEDIEIKNVELKSNGIDRYHAYDEKTDTYYFSRCIE